jgi:hypothetical protein
MAERMAVDPNTRNAAGHGRNRPHRSSGFQFRRLRIDARQPIPPIPGWFPSEEGQLHDIIDEVSCYAGHRVDEPLVPADVHA